MKTYTRKELAALYGRTISWSHWFPGEGKPARIAAADFAEYAKDEGYPTPAEIEEYHEHLRTAGDIAYSLATRFAAAELALRFAQAHMMPRSVKFKGRLSY